MPKIARFIIWISSKFTKPEIEQIVTSKLPEFDCFEKAKWQEDTNTIWDNGLSYIPIYLNAFLPAIRPELTAKPADAPVEPLIA